MCFKKVHKSSSIAGTVWDKKKKKDYITNLNQREHFPSCKYDSEETLLKKKHRK